MIVVGSVRPVRAGVPVAEWVRARAEAHGGFDVDYADLKEIGLPLMDEPNHPRLHEYTHAHTIAWSERVAAADAFVFVTPEYNHSFSPALKNALDYLSAEWWRKPVGFVSYGGASGGSRGVAVLASTVQSLGLVRTGSNIEIGFIGTRIVDGEFAAQEKEEAILGNMLAELPALSDALRPLR